LKTDQDSATVLVEHV